MTIKKRIWLILAVAVLLVPALVAGTVAQEGPMTLGGCEHPNPSITRGTSRTDLPADSVSTAEIQVVVSWPEESNLTGPAGRISVDLYTTLGTLTDAENESTTGRGIRLYTDSNGTVTALLSGNETGGTYITAVAVFIPDELETCNKTTVTLVAPGATPTAPSSGNGGGNGGGGADNGGAPVTTPTPSPSATETPGVTVTPAVSSTPSPITTPTVTPTASPAATPTPAPSPTPSPAGGIPGFEAGFAIAGLLAVVYVVLRKGRNA